mmetsp:Transcript_45401/g.135733  ORF Transcript_45401/g.135733 Transcript_45401/m.135733 type:complete len:437 (+) Transcript_45401:1271-2581(+)
MLARTACLRRRAHPSQDRMASRWGQGIQCGIEGRTPACQDLLHETDVLRGVLAPLGRSARRRGRLSGGAVTGSITSGPERLLQARQDLLPARRGNHPGLREGGELHGTQDIEGGGGGIGETQTSQSHGQLAQGPPGVEAEELEVVPRVDVRPPVREEPGEVLLLRPVRVDVLRMPLVGYLSLHLCVNASVWLEEHHPGVYPSVRLVPALRGEEVTAVERCTMRRLPHALLHSGWRPQGKKFVDVLQHQHVKIQEEDSLVLRHREESQLCEDALPDAHVPEHPASVQVLNFANTPEPRLMQCAQKLLGHVAGMQEDQVVLRSARTQGLPQGESSQCVASAGGRVAEEKGDIRKRQTNISACARPCVLWPDQSQVKRPAATWTKALRCLRRRQLRVHPMLRQGRRQHRLPASRRKRDASAVQLLAAPWPQAAADSAPT